MNIIVLRVHEVKVRVGSQGERGGRSPGALNWRGRQNTTYVYRITAIISIIFGWLLPLTVKAKNFCIEAIMN
jgi:hypothetical protein